VRDAFDKAESKDTAATRGSALKSTWRDHIIKPRELCDRVFPEVRHIVPGIFPEGVILLASRPKLGKSWLVLQVTTAIASGTTTLVVSDRPACGDALYLALEDNERRLQRRLTKYFGVQRENWPERLKLVTTWRRLDQGGLDDLREWCREVTKPTLIVIDVLKKVRPPKGKNQSDYEADYSATEGLKQLIEEFPGLAIICVHHDRKMDADDVFDTVSVTLGLTGGVDTVAIIKRSGKGITLHVEGRDLIEPVEKAISFDRDTCRWTVLGEAAEVHRSGERSRVLVALANLPDGLTISEIQIAAELGSRPATDVLLSRMVRDGEIVRSDRGRYSLLQYRCKNVRNGKEYEDSSAKHHPPAHTPSSNNLTPALGGAHTPCVEFLLWALTPGRRLVRDVEASAREEGLLGERQRIDNAKSLQDAKRALKVVVEREGFGAGSKVYWRLPDDRTQDAAPAKDDAAVQAPERESGGNL
jgi:hypothetical protein